MKPDRQEYRNILIVIDKFKGSLTSELAAEAVARGLEKGFGALQGRDRECVWESNKTVTKYNKNVLNIEIVEFADGGDGSAGVLEKYRPTKKVVCQATGPRGSKIATEYLLYEPECLPAQEFSGKTNAAPGEEGCPELPAENVWPGKAGCQDALPQAWRGAFIEMAKISGLELLSPRQRNPLYTTTYGLGELIRHAVALGVREITLSIGGSATNDGGTGMLQALGYRFLDENGEDVTLSGDKKCPGKGYMNGSLLGSIGQIDAGGRLEGLDKIKLKVICDVANPLLGPDGATYMYGPQKGAGTDMLEKLEAGMRNFAWVAANSVVRPGAGAAGGTGFALNFFLDAEMIPGKEFFARLTGLERKIRQSDLVITGEGKLDLQSFRGKAVDGVLELAAKYRKPVWIFCGKNELNGQSAQSPADGASQKTEIKNDIRKRLAGVPVRALEELEPCAEKSMRNAAPLLEELVCDTVLRTIDSAGRNL